MNKSIDQLPVLDYQSIPFLTQIAVFILQYKILHIYTNYYVIIINLSITYNINLFANMKIKKEIAQHTGFLSESWFVPLFSSCIAWKKCDRLGIVKFRLPKQNSMVA